MTTTWDRIDTTDNGQAFKTWLTNRMITEEVFNEFSFEEIDKWRTKFDQQQQPNELEQGGTSKAITNQHSKIRGPIVLVDFSGKYVDTNTKDPKLMNAAFQGAVACLNEKEAKDILNSIKLKLFPDGDELQFVTDHDNCEVYANCLATSSNWLDDEKYASKLFENDQNEQLQMHLGGSNLVFYPLLFAAHKISLKQGTNALLCADAEWASAEVLTHTSSGERLKLKVKADAWLQLELLQNENSKIPIFHFEHKVKDESKAYRKAILLSQLTWRRIFLACCVGEENSYEEALKAATRKCKNLCIWFASLDGKKFQIGALKGTYECKGRDDTSMEEATQNDSRAKFEYVSTMPIDVVKNGKRAKELMYALSLQLPIFAEDVSEFLPDKMNSAALDRQQDFSKAQSASKRQTKSSDGGKDKRSRASGGGGGAQQAVPTNCAATGFAKKAFTIELLNNDVTNVKHMWAIPSDAFFERITPFDGDHIFSGTWKGDEDLCSRGERVVVKSFSGEEELDNYDNEVGVLKAIRAVPHVQKLILARKAEHIDFAVIVSLMQPTTSSCIGSLEYIQEVGRQVLKVLVELRSLGIIHRDIKPSNILWSPSEKSATVIDFGLATIATMERVSPKGVNDFPYILSSSGNVGTEGYQAPEVLANCSYNEKIDVYSLGMSLQNIAAAAGIQDNACLDEAIRIMTEENPSERCTALMALDLAFFR